MKSKAKAADVKKTVPARRRQTVIVVVPGGKISKPDLRQLARNPTLLDEDEADYQYSIAAIGEGGKPIPLAKILRRYGRR